MSRAVQVSQRFFGEFARRNLRRHPDLANHFAKSRILLHPQAYLAITYTVVTLAAVLGLVLSIGLVVASHGSLAGRYLLVAFLPVPTFALFTYLFLAVYPELRIQRRARSIEANLPYALNYLSALTSAGVSPQMAFASLAKQGDVYGEVAAEARWIYRDVDLLGKDILTALMDASRRSPSRQFAEFLQGSVSTVASGGNLAGYFLLKAQQASEILRRTERSFVENVGVMAESYVVVAAAGPLFLVVIVSVLTLVNPQAMSAVLLVNLIAFFLLPILHAVFAGLIKNMKPEA